MLTTSSIYHGSLFPDGDNPQHTKAMAPIGKRLALGSAAFIVDRPCKMQQFA
jgi:hypothetical protein